MQCSLVANAKAHWSINFVTSSWAGTIRGKLLLLSPAELALGRALHRPSRVLEILDYSREKYCPMGKKSHAPLFTLFVYFTHLVPPTGLF